jgi:hypothetical protein
MFFASLKEVVFALNVIATFDIVILNKSSV